MADKLHSMFTTKPISFNVRPDLMRVSTESFTECKNIIITQKGYIVPRTEDNLKALHRYVKRKFKTNMYDKRTRAYKYMVRHDSEFPDDKA